MTASSHSSVTAPCRQGIETVAGRCLRRRLSGFDCKRCVESCAPGALTVTGAEIHLEKVKCNGCGRCTAVCPAEALVFSGYDLHEELKRCGTFENTVFCCRQTTHSPADGFRLPCLGALTVEALLFVGLKTTGAVYFDLTDCPDCDKHQAVQTFPGVLAGVQQALAEDSSGRLIPVTDRVNLPASLPGNRRSFLLDMGDTVISYIRHRYGSPVKKQESSAASSRHLPQKNVLLEQAIASRTQSVSGSLLSRCSPSLLIRDSCTLCPRCTGMCPTGALKLTQHCESGGAKKLSFTAARCTGCGLCAAFCKAEAITVCPPALLEDSAGH